MLYLGKIGKRDIWKITNNNWQPVQWVVGQRTRRFIRYKVNRYKKMPWQWLLLLLLVVGEGSGASKRGKLKGKCNQVVNICIHMCCSVSVKMCLQPMISGRCFGQIESYAYNPLQRRCEEFIYGGCGGNGNRFDSKAECEYNCRDI